MLPPPPASQSSSVTTSRNGCQRHEFVILWSIKENFYVSLFTIMEYLLQTIWIFFILNFKTKIDPVFEVAFFECICVSVSAVCLCDCFPSPRAGSRKMRTKRKYHFVAPVSSKDPQIIPPVENIPTHDDKICHSFPYPYFVIFFWEIRSVPIPSATTAKSTKLLLLIWELHSVSKMFSIIRNQIIWSIQM